MCYVVLVFLGSKNSRDVVNEKLFVYLRHIRGANLCVMVRVPDRIVVRWEAEIRPIALDTGNAETGKKDISY